jgi:hypothetical protein
MKETITLTPALRIEVEKSIIQTYGIIDKEMAYSEDLRNNERIEKYTLHLQKLQNALVVGYI